MREKSHPTVEWLKIKYNKKILSTARGEKEHITIKRKGKFTAEYST